MITNYSFVCLKCFLLHDWNIDVRNFVVVDSVNGYFVDKVNHVGVLNNTLCEMTVYTPVTVTVVDDTATNKVKVSSVP